MKKFILLLSILTIGSAFADSQDENRRKAITLCGENYNVNKNGTGVTVGSWTKTGDKWCAEINCNEKQDDGNKSSATRTRCLTDDEYKQYTLDFVNGNLAPKPAGGDGAGGTPGGAAGGNPGGVGAGGTTANGNPGGAGGNPGATTITTGAGSSADAYHCEELEGEGRIRKGDPCYNECKPKLGWKFWEGKKAGLDRKSCVECLLRHRDLYKVKPQYLPKDKNGNIIGDKSVNLGNGVSIRTGIIICKDANGKIVKVEAPNCPAGTTLELNSDGKLIGARPGGGNTTITLTGSGSTTASVGNGAGVGAGGSLVVSGGGSIGAGGAGTTIIRDKPDYCYTRAQNDIRLCDEWMLKHDRFGCSHGSNLAACTGGASNDILSRYDLKNCVNCQANGGVVYKQSVGSQIAEVAAAIAPFGMAAITGYYGYRSNKAFADSQVKVAEQCRLAVDNYVGKTYASEMELSPTNFESINKCNGYAMNAHAGLGNPYLSGLYGAGYSPGMIGGLMGPYGSYNPYGLGGIGIGGQIGIGGVPGIGGIPGVGIGGQIGVGGIGGMYPGVGGIGGMYPGVGGIGGMYPGVGGVGGIPGIGIGGQIGIGGIGGIGGMYPGVGGIGGIGGVGGMYPGVGGIGGIGGVGGMYPGVGGIGGIGGVGGMYPGVGGIGGIGGVGGMYPGVGGVGGMSQVDMIGGQYDRMLQQQGTAYQMSSLGGFSPYGASGYPMNLGGQIGFNASLGASIGVFGR